MAPKTMTTQMGLIESLETETKQLEHLYAVHPDKDFDAGYYAGKIQATKDFVKLLNSAVDETPVVIWGEPLRQNNNTQLKIQRRICAEKYKYFCHNNFKQLIYDDILNSPEPE